MGWSIQKQAFCFCFLEKKNSHTNEYMTDFYPKEGEKGYKPYHQLAAILHYDTQKSVYDILSSHAFLLFIVYCHHHLVKNSDRLHKARSPVGIVNVSVGNTFRCRSIQHLAVTGINSYMIDYSIIIGIEKY